MLRQYTVPIFISALYTLIAYFLRPYSSGLDLLLLSFLPILVCSFYGNLRTSLFSVFLVNLGSAVIVGPTDLLKVFTLLLVLAQQLLVVALFFRAKKESDITKFQQKIKELTIQVESEKIKNLKSLEEIKSRDEFLSIASHELKTPLTLSLLQIQKALHNIRNVTLANFSVQNLMDMLESVEQQTDRLSKMIQDLSNISLITTGRMKLSLEDVDLNKVVKDVLERVPSTMYKADYPIKFEGDFSAQGRWDKVRIEQVVTNLVSNAIKYGLDKPIEVKIQRENGLVKVIFKDNGLGIPKDMQQKIFGKFERGDVDKKYQGLGVGLYITHQIIAAHGGEIKLESHLNKGSKFTVELPIETKPTRD